jgi:hypothetical protein
MTLRNKLASAPGDAPFTSWSVSRTAHLRADAAGSFVRFPRALGTVRGLAQVALWAGQHLCT